MQQILLKLYKLMLHSDPWKEERGLFKHTKQVAAPGSFKHYVAAGVANLQKRRFLAKTGPQSRKQYLPPSFFGKIWE